MTKLNILKPFPLLVHEQQRLFAPISSTETFEKKDVNTIMTIYNNSVTIRKHHYDHMMYPKIFVSLMTLTKKYKKGIVIDISVSSIMTLIKSCFFSILHCSRDFYLVSQPQANWKTAINCIECCQSQ